MPCQCNPAATASGVVSASCECASDDPVGACECGAAGGGGGAPRSSSLERVVMELDKRVRALETSARS